MPAPAPPASAPRSPVSGSRGRVSASRTCVVVTGGAGFIGSHCVEALLAQGAEVRIVDRLDDFYDTAPRRARIPAAARFFEADIRDAHAMRVACAGADAVLHLAARPGVRESLLDPETTLVQNVLGTSAVLEAMRAEGVPTLVFASSSSVYGARRGESLSEGDAADRPASPYGASKRAAELLCYAAHATWGVHVTAARLFTVYGPRQRPGMAIARFCRQIRAGEPITLYGDGTSARDYTFVADAADGLLAALDHTEGYRVLNLAGGHSVTLAALVATLGEVLGLPVRTERLPDQPGDVPETRADLTAAAQWLGWSPRVDLRAGLTRYVNWLDAGQP